MICRSSTVAPRWFLNTSVTCIGFPGRSRTTPKPGPVGNLGSSGGLTAGLTVAGADSVVITGFPGVAGTSDEVSRSCSVRSWHAPSQQAIRVASPPCSPVQGGPRPGSGGRVHQGAGVGVSRGPSARGQQRQSRQGYRQSDVVSHAGSSATVCVLTNGHSCWHCSRTTPLDLNRRVPSPPLLLSQDMSPDRPQHRFGYLLSSCRSLPK